VIVPEAAEALRPAKALHPPGPPGPLAWAHRHLFNSWFNAILTIVSRAVLYWALKAVIGWVFFTADWRPVTSNPLLFLVGQYPRDQLWRVGAGLLMVSFLFGVSWGVWGGIMRSFAVTLGAVLAAAALLPTSGIMGTTAYRAFLLANPLLIYLGFLLGKRPFMSSGVTLIGWLLSLVIIPVLLHGFQGSRAIPPVATTSWGGLVVTLILAVGGILLSFPIGVFLALGRRSSLPVLRIFCTLLIEVVRGVPLVTILFMSSIILALFLPPELRIDRLVRALLGMTLFSAAYTAENVRGGLQAIPQGQIEAAKAVGLNSFQTTLLIVLPQALRAVIPAIVGQFISLFKDTTLAIIVAINELLNIGKSILQSNTEFLQLQAEVYVFVAAVFWILSYLMSYASRRLEATLGVGER
jgi:general L-amino acid transport system permease protein